MIDSIMNLLIYIIEIEIWIIVFCVSTYFYASFH